MYNFYLMSILIISLIQCLSCNFCNFMITVFVVSTIINYPWRIHGAADQRPASHSQGPEFESRALHVGFVIEETSPDRFSSWLLPFSPATNFISPFLHSFLQPLPRCIRRGLAACLLIAILQYRCFIASHLLTLPCVGQELRIFIIHISIYILHHFH